MITTLHLAGSSSNTWGVGVSDSDARMMARLHPGHSASRCSVATWMIDGDGPPAAALASLSAFTHGALVSPLADAALASLRPIEADTEDVEDPVTVEPPGGWDS